MKKFFLLIFSILVVSVLLFVVFKKKNIELINIEDLLIYYQTYKFYINDNKFVFIIIYLFFSVLWICFFGIMIPMLILSTLMFEYLAFFLSMISFTTGSLISYLFAKKFKKFLGNSPEKIVITENSFFLYIIFRCIPGVPYVVKNISGIFFNFRNRDFLIATIIADTPQIFLIIFLIKRLVDSSEILTSDLDIMLISKHFFLPAFLIVLFLIAVFLIKIKFKKYFYKK